VKRVALVALAIGLAGISFGAAACGSDDDGGAPAEAKLDLVVGSSLPLSGELEAFGPAGEKAGEIAVGQIEQAIRETDSDDAIEIVNKNNGSDPQIARGTARQMIQDDGATCLVGPWGVPDSAEVFESESSPEGVLQITPTSVGDELSDIDDPDGLLNFTSLPSGPQGSALAGYMEKQLGGAQGVGVNIGARSDAYGTGIADAFRSAWEDRGGTVGENVSYDPDQASYNADAKQITSGSPDAFVIVDLPDTYAKIGPALAQQDTWDATRTFVTDGLISGELPKAAGTEATEGIRGTAPGAPDKGEAAEAFDDLYRGTEPKDVVRQTFDAQTFDAVVLCFLAAVAAGSTDGTEMAVEVRDITGPPGEMFTWEELPEAIEALQNGDDIDYAGASGEIDMDEAGNPTAGVYDVYRYENGELELFDEVPVEDVASG